MVSTETQNLYVVDTTISPGSDKAILITSTGATIDLTDESGILKIDGTDSIKLEGNNINYLSSKVSSTALSYNTLKIPRGGKFSLILSDGTKVWLNSETELKYPVAFGGDIREVELIGEAYFEVRENLRPFVMKSNNYKIVVLGTIFNISAYEDDDEIKTTLVKGSVRIDINGSGISQMLVPNDHSSFNKKSGQIIKRQVDIDKYVGWKDGLLVFDEAMLADILTTLSRWYDVTVYYENNARRTLRYPGEIKRYEEFREILRLIEKTQTVKFEIDGRKVKVK